MASTSLEAGRQQRFRRRVRIEFPRGNAIDHLTHIGGRKTLPISRRNSVSRKIAKSSASMRARRRVWAFAAFGQVRLVTRDGLHDFRDPFAF